MSGRPVISLCGVRVRYGGRTGLAGVDLRVDTGERVALVGPSGAGKSTLLRVVGGLVRPDAGAVEVLGHDPLATRGRQRRQLRSRIGTVHQGLDLAGPLRVVHNVNAGRLGRWSLAGSVWSLLRPADPGRVLAALDAVGLADRLWARTDELSGGEQQRVAVARVLLQQPALVLADEPVSSLDPALGDRVLGLLCQAGAERRRASLVSLHDPGLAKRHCDRLVGLRAGAVVFDLPAARVDEARLAALYGGDGP